MNNNFVYRVLSPLQFSGEMNGDWGYEINGQRSENSYVSRRGAENAMRRQLERMGFYNQQEN